MSAKVDVQKWLWKATPRSYVDAYNRDMLCHLYKTQLGDESVIVGADHYRMHLRWIEPTADCEVIPSKFEGCDMAAAGRFLKRYPGNLRSILGQPIAGYLRVIAGDLLRAAKLAKPFAKNRANIVCLHHVPNRPLMGIYAWSLEHGDVETTIPADRANLSVWRSGLFPMRDRGFVVCVNVFYLLDLLSGFRKNEMVDFVPCGEMSTSLNLIVGRPGEHLGMVMGFNWRTANYGGLPDRYRQIIEGAKDGL